MGSPDWRDRMLIDLTNESDSDSDGPLESITDLSKPRPKTSDNSIPQNAQPSQRPPPNAIPAPPSEEKRTLQQNSMTGVIQNGNWKPSALRGPVDRRTLSSTTNSLVAGLPAPTYSHVSSTGSAKEGRLDIRGPEKRRKLSIGDRSRTYIFKEDTKGAPATTGKPNVNSGMRLSNMNGGPTVHSLNAALKTKTNLLIPTDILAKEPRSLHIGRSTDDEEGFLDVLAAPKLQVHPTPLRSAYPAAQHAPLEQELGASDLDCEITDGDYADFSVDSFHIQTPRRKSRESLITGVLSSPNQYRLKKPKSAKVAEPSTIPSSARPPFQTAYDYAEQEDGKDEHEDEDDEDSVISNVPSGQFKKIHNARPSRDGFSDTDVAVPRQNFEPAMNSHGNRKYTNRFKDEEDHLLVYLKEIKQLKWTDIAKEFPGRTWATLQTHYSQKLNRRDRSLDPPHWNSPPKFAHEVANTTRTSHTSTVGQITRKPREKYTKPHARMHQAHLDPDRESSYSSTSEPVTRRAIRPRRSLKTVNYTWPKRGQHLDNEYGEWQERDSLVGETRERSVSDRPSTEPFADVSTVLGPSIAVDERLDVDFDEADAKLVLSDQKASYLSSNQRSIIRYGSQNGDWDVVGGRSWKGSIIHVDFTDNEMDIVAGLLGNMSKPLSAVQSTSRRRQLQKILEHATDATFLKISHALQKRLRSRDKDSIDAFLEDAQMGRLRGRPRIERLGAVRPHKELGSNPKTSVSSFLRQRELGQQSRRGWKSPSQALTYQMKNVAHDTLGPASCYTGASGDVHTVAWSMDGEYFAAGAVCPTDPDSVQYNMPNNLLYGNPRGGRIYELAQHHVPRQMTDSGPNSTHAMYASQDRRVFTTVSSVLFSPDGEFMISAGYDDYAYVWALAKDGSQPRYQKCLKHKAEVDIMTVNCNAENNLLATASKRVKGNSIKVIADYANNPRPEGYISKKALEHPDQNILPTALKFEPNYGRWLLGGFGANRNHDRLDMNGDICLWDVETKEQISIHGSARNVFDLAFNPIAKSQPQIAVGCVAGMNVNRGTRSLVRLYDGRAAEKFSLNMELECPALDMNDVMYCPYDENIVAAGCTDGRVYIWDIRKPDILKYTLSHGESLAPLNSFEDREVVDTGVRFLSWGENATRLFSGSSDGIVKAWDVVRSTEEVFLKDVISLNSGIMSGAFSPDSTRLVVGEVNGSINVLEVGRYGETIRDMERLEHVAYFDTDEEDDVDDIEGFPDGHKLPSENDSGRDIAAAAIESGGMKHVPFGGFPVRQAVQGPHYTGPFHASLDAPYLRERALEFQLGLANLAKATDSQCEIPLCKDRTVRVTSEEVGDSKRSGDRIPDELVQQWREGLSRNAVIPGKSKCKTCSRPARPLDPGARIDDIILCERCGFACFRCGELNAIPPHTKQLSCTACSGVWEIGALGYECVQKPSNRVLLPDVPTLNGFDKDLFLARLDLEDNGYESPSFGDEVNALTDYYHSLALDSPPT